jgi:hypothetical protein
LEDAMGNVSRYLALLFVVTVTIAVSFAQAQDVAAVPTADRVAELEARIARLEELVAHLQATSAPANSPVPAAMSLDEAVRIFNAQAQADQVGKDQPPLTVDEVVGAIRWFDRNEAPVTDAEFTAFRNIAETKQLPRGTEFEVISDFIPGDGFRYTRWSVRIRMPRTAAPGGSFAYSLRERTIRAEPETGEERKARLFP